MAGWAAPPTADLLAGVIYQPYYLAMMVLAAVIVWAAPQSWDWTRRLDLRKAVICLLLLGLALVALATQEFNPFIYFIF